MHNPLLGYEDQVRAYLKREGLYLDVYDKYPVHDTLHFLLGCHPYVAEGPVFLAEEIMYQRVPTPEFPQWLELCELYKLNHDKYTHKLLADAYRRLIYLLSTHGYLTEESRDENRD